MLDTARTAVTRDEHADRITLGQGLAEELDPSTHLGVDGPFDVIFFSYVLSMIPPWPAALGRALAHLAPDGRLYIVDFWDQSDLSAWIAPALQRWLALFDVKPRFNLPQMLRTVAEQGWISYSIESVAQRYAYLATVAPRPEQKKKMPRSRTIRPWQESRSRAEPLPSPH
jgi:S-adenosylmethionine-diacylgycerolhomoserine-N-methlytransferase